MTKPRSRRFASTVAALCLVAACKADSAPSRPATAARAEGDRVPGRALPPRAQPRPALPPREGRAEGRGRGTWAELSPEERDVLRAEQQTRRDERMREMIATFDADQDGKLSEPERAAMREARSIEAVDRLDTDHDGKLSEAELALRPTRGFRPPPDFATLDADHDGFVTIEELDLGRARRGPRGGRAPGVDDAPAEQP